ncbi:DUF2971 domain-containing protein, partial [Clostridium sardiniense]|uniref:DUF2971 domain-containing protein n=1 Tax=Clostridium sardiniense TaxID=29369 RepID=UPI00195B57B9
MEYKEYDNGKDLYHFTNINSLMRIVLTNQFLFNSIKNMNDINESISFFENEYNKKKFDIYIEEYVKDDLKHMFDFELEQKIYLDNKDSNLAKKEIINDWLKKRNFSAASRIEEMIDAFMGNIKLCCFNEIGNETIIEKHLLWGHYAKSNTGMAIKFNKDKLISIFKSKINKQQLICYGEINYENKDSIRK